MGSKASGEVSIFNKLKSMLGVDTKTYYILWRFAPHLLPDQTVKTFEDLTNKYKVFSQGHTETFCKNWLYEENMQIAVKWLLKRQHNERLIELYDMYFEKAKSDVNAFKAFIDFSKDFFVNEKDSELLNLVKGAKIDTHDTDTDGDEE